MKIIKSKKLYRVKCGTMFAIHEEQFFVRAATKEEAAAKACSMYLEALGKSKLVTETEEVEISDA